MRPQYNERSEALRYIEIGSRHNLSARDAEEVGSAVELPTANSLRSTIHDPFHKPHEASHSHAILPYIVM